MSFLPTKINQLLCSAADGIIMIDEEEHLMLMNQAARDIFELSEGDYSGQPVTSVINHSNFNALLEEKAGASFCQDEISMEDGKVYNANLSRIPGAGAVIILQDITRLKELNRVKSELVTTVAHDLRSPLTAILGYSELIDRVGTVNEQQREFIRRIQFSISSITNLINDLLDLGRIEAGFDIQKDMVSLNSIVRHAVESLRSQIEEKQQQLHLEFDDDLPNLLGNSVRLRQLAENLIGNAVKYTPLGGQIWVRTRSEASMLFLQVQDTGPGIPSHEQPHVFTKFYRGNNIPSETLGTGLGLAIVKSIAENHQGRVWVDSSVGAGSNFTVVLPLSIDAPQQPISPYSPE
jgi:two-component system phosphate regulon sensor histidine kinase PhoR